ncbi:MAG: hypothetical protein HY902_01775 [Deltaproteobacteria bacterium]|nr:hypothetical protein [Deltaproteobacteria bacterium]
MRMVSRLRIPYLAMAVLAVLAATTANCSDSAGRASSGVGDGGGDRTDTADSDSLATDTAAKDALGSASDASDGAVADAAAAETLADLQWRAPLGPRRGPIAVHISAPAGATAAIAAQAKLQVQIAGQWNSAALLGPAMLEGGDVVFVWDSFANFAQDGSAAVRATVANQVVEHTVELRNAATTARLVLTAHPSMDLPSGGSGPQNREIGALLLVAGAVQGEEVRVEVGKGPESLSAAPHGRATANVDGSDGTFSLVATPLAPASSAITVLFTQPLPHGWAADLAWSRDGRSLYVLGTSGELSTQPATLWRYDPAEDLSALGVPTPLATFDRPAMALAVERDHPTDRDEWAYVVLGSGPDADLGRVAAVARHGGLAAPVLDSDVAVPNDFAVSPAGGLALLSSDLFGNLLVRYDLSQTIFEKARIEPKKVPFNMVFHPGSTANQHVLLVSNLDKNSVTPMTVTPVQVKEGTAVGGLPLAAEMDIVERGPNTGLALVSALNTLVGVQLQTDGTAKKVGVLKEFGSGTSNFSGAVAVQR